jgi:hypothetical protein
MAVYSQCREQKWFVLWRQRHDLGPSEDDRAQAGAKFFEANGPTTGLHALVPDVGSHLFGSMTSTALLALQFALYTGIDRCDSYLRLVQDSTVAGFDWYRIERYSD